MLKEKNVNKDKQIAGLKEYCAASYTEAREAVIYWTSNKPRSGYVFENMKCTRTYFKLTLRQCHRDQDRLHNDSLAKKLMCKQSK